MAAARGSRSTTDGVTRIPTYVQGGPLGWQLVALHMGRAE